MTETFSSFTDNNLFSKKQWLSLTNLSIIWDYLAPFFNLH